MPNYDQSTWLAYRALSAQEMGPPELPEHVALPGAKAAISHAHLLAHQDAGRQERDVVERVNAKWQQANADLLAEHAAWAAGPYQAAIEQMRHDADTKAAERLRKQALWDEIVSERVRDDR
jgi:hypothetical protein